MSSKIVYIAKDTDFLQTEYYKNMFYNIFFQKYLVILQKSSTFAPCFSWY